MIIKELSEKQIRAYSDSKQFLIILEGAVRSGKSLVTDLMALDRWQNGPEGYPYVIVGKNEGTILRNIIEPLNEITGGLIRYKHTLRQFTIFGKVVHVIGANDERAEGKIRGATFAGALVDEGTLLPENFFKMLLTRLSVPRAQCIVTTNPDSPYHWLKTDFIDRAPEIEAQVWSFNLDDNPFLDDSYKNRLKKQFTGLWYRRFILGEWVLAEGAIYDFFDKTHHVVRRVHTYAKYYILAIDYGTTNPFAAVLIGFNDEHRPHIWIEKEYYWDSKKMGHQKTDADYARDIQKQFGDYPIKLIYVDPSAISFHLELRRFGMPVVAAKNDVIDGIRFVSTMFTEGNLVVHESCHNLIREIEGYVWDEKSARLGVDEPKKERDHACVTGDTLVSTDEGVKRMDDLSFNELVVTYDKLNERFTYRCTEASGLTSSMQEIYELELENGRILRATGDHQVWTKRGYVQIWNLIDSDEVLCYSPKHEPPIPLR